MTNLEALSLIGKGNTDAGFLSSLSALEHLHTLKFDIDDSEIDHADSNRPLPSSSFFPSLRTLEVFGPPPRIANSLAIFEEGHPLRQLKWESSSLGPQIDVPDLALWTSATRTIALKFPYLHDLKLKILTPRNFLSPAQAYFLEPLLELNFLEVLHLQFPWLSFSDAEFERMAVAWPHLRSLRLLGSSGIPKATISSLQSFAIHCPNLHSLSFAFDARQFKLPSPSVDEPISFSKLHTLDVQDSPVDDSLLLGRHLDRIFPNIIGIEGTDNPKIWAEVLTTINNLLLARSDQRAREEATRMNFSP
ncbi:hypothetical protein C0991_008877 [Blastosporella zonata]|nr:hypothetical protein C0991_008877 [Blastosporella zonata]